jgi:hypothetical protein
MKPKQQMQKMEPIKQKLYGYSCEVCRTEVYLLKSAEEYLYCPFCAKRSTT